MICRPAFDTRSTRATWAPASSSRPADRRRRARRGLARRASRAGAAAAARRGLGQPADVAERALFLASDARAGSPAPTSSSTAASSPTTPGESARAYGWRDFDPEVVEGLVENDSRFINRRANGWIACPLSGHFGEELAWQEDNYRKGSVLHGDPPASFRAAPTYVLERPLDNVIAGRELIADAMPEWGNAEATRLGNENSEGALTWNVFRSLQEAGRLGVAARVLAEARGRGRAGALLLGTADRADAGRAPGRTCRRSATSSSPGWHSRRSRTPASTFPAGGGC